ncbi:hypothetical protein ACFQ51_38935 [Streptomyces kaempferi]
MNAPKNGEEVERQELSHLLPRPGTPRLSPARSQRLEEYLMQEVTQIGAQAQPSPAAKRGMPRWSLIAAPVAALAVAAAVAVNVTGAARPPTTTAWPWHRSSRCSPPRPTAPRLS